MPLSPDIKLTTIDGESKTLGDFAARALLVVNVASKCGLTPQYEGLEALHRRFGPRGLSVLGFPCNQFGYQEPGEEREIKAFCERVYAVGFPMFAKIEVNGPATHPLFAALKRAAPGVLGSEAIKWNFTKFLVGRDGEALRRYAPTDAPASLAEDIEAALSAPAP